VKDKSGVLSNSLKIKGCFFCFRDKVIILAGLILFLTSPALARQSLEYSTVTGLWGYSEKDAVFSPSSQQSLEYSTVTGLWDYSTREAASSFPARQVVGYNPVTGLWH